MEQLSFASLDYQAKKKRTKREKFHNETKVDCRNKRDNPKGLKLACRHDPSLRPVMHRAGLCGRLTGSDRTD